MGGLSFFLPFRKNFVKSFFDLVRTELVGAVSLAEKLARNVVVVFFKNRKLARAYERGTVYAPRINFLAESFDKLTAVGLHLEHHVTAAFKLKIVYSV